MSTILVVDDKAVFREPIAAALRQQGYETRTAANGREALLEAKSDPPALILLDVAMPQMDGLTVLRHLRADPYLQNVPVILLTAVGSRDCVVKAAKLGVRDYLLKSRFSLEELTNRIHRALSPEPPSPSGDDGRSEGDGVAGDAAAGKPNTALEDLPGDPTEALKSLKPLLTRSAVTDRLEAAGEMKAMSPTVSNVLKLTGNKGSSIDQIAKAIKQDHAIAIKILKMANSSVYTRGEPVDTIERAVTRIGFDQIRQVMLNINVLDHFGSCSIGDETSGGLFWEHAIACGTIAAEIAHHRGQHEADMAFTMGLVHDVGRLIYASEFPEEYRQVVETSHRLRLPLEQIESRLMLLNHADGMDRLLHAWKFPKDLIDPIAFHHLSVGNIRRMAPRRVDDVATLALANRLCHALALGSSGNETIYPTEEFFQALKVSESVIQHIEETARDETANLKLSLLAQSNEAGWDDAREKFRSMLAGPFRPLYVSERPALDAFRMFCDQIGDRDGETPNIAVVHMREARERLPLSKALARAESDAGARGVPVLVLSPKASLTLSDDVAKDRRVIQLPTPVTVRWFIDATNLLVADAPEAKAAA